MNRAQKAAEYHQKGYNCAQAIVCAFCDKVGLDEKTAFKVSDVIGYGLYGIHRFVTVEDGDGETLHRILFVLCR